MVTPDQILEIQEQFPAMAAWEENRFKELIAEVAHLRMTLEGRDKALALLNAGTESQAEICDGLKQENRRLREENERLNELLAVRPVEIGRIPGL